MREILTPWGLSAALVQRATDGRWYAVLRDHDPQLPPLAGGPGSTADEALAVLAAQCLAVAGDRPPEPV